jgi:hypothetical protein
MVGSSEHGNGPAGSVKGGLLRDYLSVLASQEGLCSM